MAATQSINSPFSRDETGESRWFGLQSLPAGLLFAVSWKLWIPQSDFPQTPIFQGTEWPEVLAWGCVALVVAGLLLQLSSLFFTSALRPGTALTLLGALLLIVEDQHRLQAWMVHLLWVWTILLVVPRNERRRTLLWLTVVIYVYSALSKLNPLYVDQHGQTLLRGLSQLLAWDVGRIPAGTAWAFPILELLLAGGLLLRRTRRAAAWLSVLMHLALIAVFSPWGLNHAGGVLIWNGYFIGQAAMLWCFESCPVHDEPRTVFPVRLLWCVMGLLPLARWTGHLDQWVGWSLYSPRTDVIRIRLDQRPPEFPAERFRTSLPHAMSDEPAEELLSDRWSLQALAVPLNPDSRLEMSVAIALCRRFDLWEQMEIERETRSLFDPKHREQRQFRGKQAILALADEYRLNPFPNARFDAAGNSPAGE